MFFYVVGCGAQDGRTIFEKADASITFLTEDSANGVGGVAVVDAGCRSGPPRSLKRLFANEAITALKVDPVLYLDLSQAVLFDRAALSIMFRVFVIVFSAGDLAALDARPVACFAWGGMPMLARYAC